jgi:hypothetical protein
LLHGGEREQIVPHGHDCIPCGANTSLVDFERNPKPAALTLKNLWRTS